MKLTRPDYFDEIHQKTVARWHQLEQDQELAAPWWQLFKQVQFPRHVISELLQNADDVEAIECLVEVSDTAFTFTHNGKDFSRDDFASICRFGYSNKRFLHTIGFRGIGFKSTFSLGTTVELRTPSLAVAFHSNRFTLPEWIETERSSGNQTQIRVEISDKNRQKEISNNVEDWKNSPFSLLFFNHLRNLRLDDHEMHWSNLGSGPTPNSEWMSLNGDDKKYLVIRSREENFPDSALEEIKQERLLGKDEKFSLPPCDVEIVLGAPGKLFVVLPTSVITSLPFAINAPFILDPARNMIKDPAISPTNKWLLRRVGKLAGRTMLQWLQREDLTPDVRAQAYDLFLVDVPDQSSLGNDCEKIIFESFLDEIEGEAYLLNDKDTLQKSNGCMVVPKELWDIWSVENILKFCAPENEAIRLLSRNISDKNIKKLVDNKEVSKIETWDVVHSLLTVKPPKPKTWHSLLTLWHLVKPYMTWRQPGEDYNIFPVRGEQVLYSAKQVCRLGEKKLLQKEDDWEFLSRYLRVIDTNWTRYITDQKLQLNSGKNDLLGSQLDSTHQILVSTKKEEAADVDNIFSLVSKTFFSKQNIDRSEIFRIAQIAAKLNAKVGSEFQFITRDGYLRSNSSTIYYDETGRLERFIPENLRDKSLLDNHYFMDFGSCTKEDWSHWLRSGNAGLRTFIAAGYFYKDAQTIAQVNSIVEEHGYSGEIEFPYERCSYYYLTDYDFPNDYWGFWNSQASDDKSYWCEFFDLLLKYQKQAELQKKPVLYQVATNGFTKEVKITIPLSRWVMKFRELPCLRDTRGIACRPVELMRRTPQTEALLDVEPFVDAKLDTEADRPILDLLGVRSLPTGPEHFLRRIQALSKAEKPPLLELAKWYEKLDKFFPECSTDDQHNIRTMFAEERLIFSDAGTWETTNSIYIYANEMDVPGAQVIHLEMNHLSLWRRLGINERPSKELAIEWLSSLPSGSKLSASDAYRVYKILGLYGAQVWNVCEHWINLAMEWVPLNNLWYCLSMQSLIPWNSLFPQIKKKTADMRMLRADVLGNSPFDVLPTLSSVLEKRLEDIQWVLSTLDLSWLHALANILEGIVLEDDALTEHVRSMAKRMQSTTGKQVDAISVIPYIDGVPAGEPEDVEIAWVENTLYVTNISKGKLSKQIPDTISDPVNWVDMREILAYCYNRNEEDIREYMQDNYRIELVVSTQEQLDEIQEQVLEDANVPVSADPEEIEWLEPAGYSSNEEPRTIPVLPVPEVGGGNVHSTPKPHPPKPVHVALIERYARAHGYSIVNEHKFKHPNGNVLQKSDDLFPWQLIDSEGEVVCYYWVREHCLEQKALEIPYEIWHGMENDPDRHAFILEDFEGNPTTMTGKRLLTLKQNGNLTLSPAAYRLNLIYKDT